MKLPRLFFVFLITFFLAQASPAQQAPSAYRVRPEWVLAHEEFLASDALEGRGSATRDEELAATYIGSEMRQFGVEPAGDNGGYVQRVTLNIKAVSGNPVLVAGALRFEHGKDMLVEALGRSKIAGPLRKIESSADAAAIQPGDIVLLVDGRVSGGLLRGAAAVIEQDRASLAASWRSAGKKPEVLLTLGDSPAQPGRLALRKEAFQALAGLSNGAAVSLEVQWGPGQVKYTWNAVGKISGSDPALKDQAILLSAHLDHLGIHEGEPGDNIYNGADDDASGCAAVLELARALAGMRPLKRTVILAFFGSEEQGGYGATYFLEHPPLPLDDVVANLEFEMIGRPDPAIPPHTLWLTGYERTTLGPELARHGARLVADPRPQQNFFERSDNYTLAKRGIVAQTISSFGLHAQYHRPDDDLEHLDIAHMTEAINSLVEPVEWLVNSDYKPEWLPGKKP
jgi:hypothetical protein